MLKKALTMSIKEIKRFEILRMADKKRITHSSSSRSLPFPLTSTPD